MAARLHPSIVVLCWSVTACSGSAGPGVHAGPAEPVSIPAAPAPAPEAPPEQIGSVPTLAIRDVSVGSEHVCALASNGGVWCWGANYTNQIAPGHMDRYSTPLRIPLSLPATHVAVADDESCAILSDGQRVCWGGSGYHDEDAMEEDGWQRFDRLVPTLPANCGLTPAGELVCRGYNYYGVLGFPVDGQAKVADDLSLSVVPLRGPVEQAALAGDFGCALVGPERELMCWGDGWGCNGPQPVDLAAKVSALSAGGARVCVLTAGGDVYQFTELPVPDGQRHPPCRDDRAVRQPVAKLAEGATQVSCFAPDYAECSMCSGCIIDQQQRVSCWHERRLGAVVKIDQPLPPEPKPLPPQAPALVEGLSHPKRIAVGDGFFCALAESGLLQCWGDNGHGQLGRGHDNDVEATPAEPAWPL